MTDADWERIVWAREIALEEVRRAERRRLMEGANERYARAVREQLALQRKVATEYRWVGERELDAAARRMSGAIWYTMAPEREPELAEVLWTVS